LPTASDSVRRARPLLGTFVEIEAAGSTQAEMHFAIEEAFEAIADVHNLMSFHEAESDVSRLNRQASVTSVVVHPWTFEVLQAAVDLHRRSAGAFDIAVAPVLQEMNLLPRPAEVRPIAAGHHSTSEAIELLSDRRVRFGNPPTRIDLGGIAKGFAVDRAIDVLRCHRIPMALVNAGGDLAAYGRTSSWNVSIRDPRDPGRLLCQVGLRDGAIASSGRPFDPIQPKELINLPIIDPRSRDAAREIHGATVRAANCMRADALTKVVMVLGPAAIDLLEDYQADALLVWPNGSVQMTSGFESAVCLAA
jgi:FAD:protein FMN transferase